jgi:hypothetical protein
MSAFLDGALIALLCYCIAYAAIGGVCGLVTLGELIALAVSEFRNRRANG